MHTKARPQSKPGSPGTGHCCMRMPLSARNMRHSCATHSSIAPRLPPCSAQFAEFLLCGGKWPHQELEDRPPKMLAPGGSNDLAKGWS